jgi:IS5 family transposase
MRQPITNSGSIRQARSAGSQKRDLRRRAAIEPVIGHLKAEHRMGRNYLAHRAGDAINTVLAAAGYNFHLLLKWLELLLLTILMAPKAAAVPHRG